MSHNNISIVPVELSGLVMLKTLSLGFNKLTSIFDLSQMADLTDLNVNNNQLSLLPNLPLNLISLHLKSNHLTSLPQELSQLSKLIDLDASFNNISALPVEMFTTSPGLVNLKGLNLSNNSLKSLDAEISNLPSLKVYCISKA